MKRRNANDLELRVQIHHETDAAVKISLDGNAKAAVWLPKQLIEIGDERSDGTTTLWITEALATAKGLV